MSEVKMDFIGHGQSTGEVAHQLNSTGRLDPAMRKPWIGKDGRSYITVHTGGDRNDEKNYKNIVVNANGTLRRDEWKTLDEAIVGVAEKRLQGTQDLINRGLVFNLGNAMGTTVLESHTVSDALEAELTMDGVTRGQNDRQEFGTNYLPIPIIHADYEINQRVLDTSRRMGNPLDTGMAERAARKVTEKLETMLFTDTDYSYGGGSIYSFLNFPHRYDFTISTAWDSLSATSTQSVGEQILKDVLDMKQDSMTHHNYYGPRVLYIPSKYETLLDNDYNEFKTKTIRERILDITNIEDIVVVDTLPDDNVLLVPLDTSYVRIVRGMDLQTVQWETEGGFVNKYKVLSIQVPQLRAEHEGNCGIIHGSV